jgi:hypothetical protein
MKTRLIQVPVRSVQTHRLEGGGWTLRAIEWDGESVRCTVWRFGLQNMTEEQAEHLAAKVRERALINLAYWKREASSPYASDMGLYVSF